jgi:hypothetical protein
MAILAAAMSEPATVLEASTGLLESKVPAACKAARRFTAGESVAWIPYDDFIQTIAALVTTSLSRSGGDHGIRVGRLTGIRDGF